MNNIKQMIATVQIYVHIMKDVEVDIRPDLSNPFELPMLISAYNTAKDYLIKNNIKIIEA